MAPVGADSAREMQPEGAADAAAPRRTPRWLIPALAVLAAAALAFGIGRFTAFDTHASQSVAPLPGTHSPEAGFARDMQLHHAQAVDMAMEIYRKTEDEEIRMMAYDMATAQSAQIGEMYSWLVNWGLPQRGDPLMAWMGHGTPDSEGAAGGHGAHAAEPAATPQPETELYEAMGMPTPAQLERLSAATGTEADCLFLTLMIRHHVGGIEMLDAVLELGTNPRVRAVAGAMNEVQQFELDAMQASLLRLGCS